MSIRKWFEREDDEKTKEIKFLMLKLYKILPIKRCFFLWSSIYLFSKTFKLNLDCFLMNAFRLHYQFQSSQFLWKCNPLTLDVPSIRFLNLLSLSLMKWSMETSIPFPFTNQIYNLIIFLLLFHFTFLSNHNL
jgi:hypothetical protein